MFALTFSTHRGSRRAPLRPKRPLLSLSLLAFNTLALLGCLLLCAHARAQTTINQTFAYTGGLQTFVVPTDVSSLFVRLWGAGGGGIVSAGGGGAFVSGSLSVVPGSTLTLLVGGKGGTVLNSSNGGFGGGGNSGNGLFMGGGGGRSGILLGATELVDAGGGGGASNPALGPSGRASGGAGGQVTGSAGGGQIGIYDPNGKGGTQTAGGAGGMGQLSSGMSGSAFQGGNAASGGGGGGGYYGGGGGNSYSTYDDYGYYIHPGGGGGGSSYTSSSLFALALAQDGSGALAGGTSDAFYLAGAGNSNGNGEIVLSYVTSAVPEPGPIALLVVGSVTGAAFARRRNHKRRA